MPLRRSRRGFSSRRRTVRRSSYGRRRPRIMTRRMRMTRSPGHIFRRATIPDILPLTSNVAGYGGTGFIGSARATALNQLINVADFTGLYDQYKIIKTTFHFKWSIAGTTPASNLLENPPVFLYFRDYDDISTPDHQAMNERATTKSFAMRPNKVYNIVVKPATLSSVYESALTTAYVPQWNKYIDMLNPGVPHFGLKCGWNYPASTAYGSIQIWQTMTIACKGQR